MLAGGVRDPEALDEAGPVLQEVDELLEGWGPAAPSAVPLADLTRREREVLTLLAEGLLARTIAVRLSLSPRTVHHHLGSIYDKLGVRDRLAAVLRAREGGLLLSAPGRRVPDSPRRPAAASPARSSSLSR